MPMQATEIFHMIREYTIKDSGYHPFLISDGWQLAQLNYTEEQAIDKITHLDVHRETDEVFVSISGQAILIVAALQNDEPKFEIELMKLNKIYNIPKDVWHNIAMKPGSEVLIAEKSNTHIADFEHLSLSKEKIEELNRMVNHLFNSNIGK